MTITELIINLEKTRLEFGNIEVGVLQEDSRENPFINFIDSLKVVNTEFHGPASLICLGPAAMLCLNSEADELSYEYDDDDDDDDDVVDLYACHECGKQFFTDTNGVNHHWADDDGLDDIDHDADLDHVPYSLEEEDFNDLPDRQKWDTWKEQEGTWHCPECGEELSDGPNRADPFPRASRHCGECDHELTRRTGGGMGDRFGWILKPRKEQT